VQKQFTFQTFTGRPVIRAARGEDIEGMARVSIDTWRLAYAGILPAGFLARMRLSAHEAQRRALMQGAGRIHFVAEEPATGETVGFCSAGPIRNGSGIQAEIYELYVQNGFQGQGLGRGLFESAKAWLATRGYQSLVVWVLADNLNRGFYERLDGIPAGVQTIRVGGALVEEAAYIWRDI
jgi:GNAT superfamily N-acetyltransferase